MSAPAALARSETNKDVSRRRRALVARLRASLLAQLGGRCLFCGADDDLTGLMENVIIGRLVPAGSGFEGSPKKAMLDRLHAKDTSDEFDTRTVEFEKKAK